MCIWKLAVDCYHHLANIRSIIVSLQYFDRYGNCEEGFSFRKMAVHGFLGKARIAWCIRTKIRPSTWIISPSATRNLIYVTIVLSFKVSASAVHIHVTNWAHTLEYFRYAWQSLSWHMRTSALSLAANGRAKWRTCGSFHRLGRYHIKPFSRLDELMVPLSEILFLDRSEHGVNLARPSNSKPYLRSFVMWNSFHIFEVGKDAWGSNVIWRSFTSFQQVLVENSRVKEFERFC